MNEYDNGYNYTVFLTNEICEEMFPGALSMPLRLPKIYLICLSLISISATSVFLIFCRSYLKFHTNVKVLFYLQLAACFMDSVITGLAHVYHLKMDISAKYYCDVVLSPSIYKWVSIWIVIPFTVSNLSLTFMVSDRTLASVFYSSYEKLANRLCIFWIFLAILMTIFTSFYMFHGVNFNYPQSNVFSSLPENATRATVMFLIFTFIEVYTAIHSIFLYRYNKKKNNSIHTRVCLGLSSKYQMNENVASSRILWQLTCAQLSANLFHNITVNILRFAVPKPRPVFWQVVKEFLYTPPIYSAMMPLLCIFTFRKSNNERSSSINSLVEMRSTGTEGWENYKKVLQDQWA